MECDSCGSRFLYPRPSIEELISFYPLHYHAYNEDHGFIAKPIVTLRAKNRVATYRRLIKSGKINLFDVGTGDCRHFDEMSLYGSFKFSGVEIKPEMVQAARQRGYEVVPGTLEDMEVAALAGSFDLVTMYQLVEHVLSPDVLFAKALSLLRPGGYVLGQLPSMDSLERSIFGRYWAGYHFPRHLQMFTKRGLKTLLANRGFSPISVTSALHLQAGLSLQNFIVGHWGSRPEMKFGKVPIYSLLLLATAPFCLAEHLLGRGGMINFLAQKPDKS